MMRRRSLFRRAALGGASILAITAFVYGCSYDWTYVDPSTRGDGGDGGDGEISKEGGPEFDTQPPEPPPPQHPCKSFNDCNVGMEFCFFQDGLCGPERTSSNGIGICTHLSQVCPGKPEGNLCSCDGTIVGSRCEAAQKGFDIDQTQAGCVKPPGGTFPCPNVPSGCKTGYQFCQVKASNPTSGACVDLTTCTPPSVTCDKCGNPLGPTCTCKDDGPQVLRVDCP